ncbi:MAG: hypothetical protein WCJ61_17635 [Paludibacter sp.]
MKTNNVLLPIAIAAAGVFLLKKKTTVASSTSSPNLVRSVFRPFTPFITSTQYTDYKTYLKRIFVLFMKQIPDSGDSRGIDQFTDEEAKTMFSFMVLGDLNFKSQMEILARKYNMPGF